MYRFHLAVLLTAALCLSGCGSAAQSGSSVTSPVQSGQNGGVSTAPVKVVSDIHKMTNWSSCSGDCSGEPGTDATYSMTQSISSPSLTGSAIEFHISSGTAWNTALWWKQVGGNDAITRYLYELSFYVADPGAGQALEFAVNQNASGWRYEYATQCDYRGSGTWRVWDHNSQRWYTSGKQCPEPVANQWNRMAWELERTSDNKVRFIAVTLNGQRSEVNMSFDAIPASGSGIDVAFQMDSISTPRPWSVWVDDIKLSQW
ncbi:MAG TPA: hypothetical protein VN577_14495 [Terriglobales bacterium]|nr:hypothetical protein [Terriglobales bacterium]